MPPVGEQQLKTLVLGMGNPILRDDGVGLRVAQGVRARAKGLASALEVVEPGGRWRLAGRCQDVRDHGLAADGHDVNPIADGHPDLSSGLSPRG